MPARIVFGLIIFTLAIFVPRPVQATISACTAGVSPSEITRGTSDTFTISVTNNDPEWEIVWVKVTRPSENFTLSGYTSIPGWDVNFSAPQIILSGSTVQPGGEVFDFSFDVTVANVSADAASWAVSVSDTDESGAVTCSGSLSTAITGGVNAAPIQSDVTLSNLTSSTVTLSWTTDKAATSLLEYGITGSYGSQLSGTATTAHSFSLDGLSADTTYHFRIGNTDTDGNSVTSGDLTFRTATAGTSATTTTTTVTVTRTVTPAPTPTPPPDTTGPAVTVSTDLDKPYTQAPQITGSARDPSGVESVEYSTDNGRNWLPAEVSGPLTSKVFAFTPSGLDDDMYPVRVRAKDGKGNTGSTGKLSLVIDRLPPLGGSLVITSPVSVLYPLADGSYGVVSGLRYGFTLSEVGGPTEVDLSVNGEIRNMRRNPENRRWSTDHTFIQPGTYSLKLISRDGAGNETVQDLPRVTVGSAGIVTGPDCPVNGAVISVYIQDPVTGEFRIWDSASYSQKNPIVTDSSGLYVLELPTGTYYLDVRAGGYRRVATRAFTLSSSAVITAPVHLRQMRVMTIGGLQLPLPQILPDIIAVGQPAPEAIEAQGPLTGTEFPFIEFGSPGGKVSSFDFRGKPAVITFLSTWHPGTPDQIRELETLQVGQQLRTILVVPQESAGVVTLFTRRGGYTSEILTDPDGTSLKELDLLTLPAHVFTDNKGVIQAVRTGLLTSEEIVETVNVNMK
ncbi:hypothetical protein A2Z33_00320 [Candidatus Gottesmanbacteria bacterium RBG_16_52_11]|uniref:Fibronectin type-III domain-containing protein n=1 Tax=Candidatus Gottesmanbacteria bacterium RBG_16_52_11 TaxID=1798374 RepID=A0A1F5YNJ6_9BACT|nr:MAG: hypothetical protein A2Z33_00320 [Candidatus Gottesmanbacteria bacterium RBG_16_52_11]